MLLGHNTAFSTNHNSTLPGLKRVKYGSQLIFTFVYQLDHPVHVPVCIFF